MPEDVQQQVQPQAHDDTIKKEQIEHPLLQQQVSWISFYYSPKKMEKIDILEKVILNYPKI